MSKGMNVRLVLIGLIALETLIGEAKDKPFMPAKGFVPDEATAIRIAEAVLIPIYGERQTLDERPYIATLKSGVWIVTGSLPKLRPGWEFIGGTAEIRIAKGDGRILQVSHGE